MSISSIGIMQGRVLPKYIDQLQIFPIDTWYEELGIAKDIGFQHIELLWDNKQDIKNAKGLVESISKPSQLHALSMCVDSICSYSLLEDILNEIVDVLNTFKENTPAILVIPLLGKATINTADRLKEFIDKLNMHQVMNLIKEYNVKLALELDMPAIDIVEALKLSNPDLIGICLDSGNLWHYSDNPIDDIYILSDKIIHVHIKDRDKEGGNVLLGNGLVDFKALSKALEDIKYSDIVTLETKYFEDPSSEAKKNFKYISRVVQHT
jgi:L-ribulose-5-phosphate 3-epimerase